VSNLQLRFPWVKTSTWHQTTLFLMALISALLSWCSSVLFLPYVSAMRLILFDPMAVVSSWWNIPAGTLS
jgi:hypothetical protein